MEEKSAYERYNEIEKERNKNQTSSEFFAKLEYIQKTGPSNYAYIINPQSEYLPLLIQDVVNAGPKYIEFLYDEPRKIASTMSPRTLTDDEAWTVDCLRKFNSFCAFEHIISGKDSLETRAMKWGMHPEWIMISATHAGNAVYTIFGSKGDEYPNYCCVTDEYKHEFEMAMAQRQFPTTYGTKLRPVDFKSLPSAAKTIDNYCDLTDSKLLAWHLGRVPNNRSTNFRDTEKFLDGVEAALVQARADLAEQQNKEAKEKEESAKRLQVDRKAELEAGRTCVANIETDRELIDWAKSKGLMVYIERKRKKYPEALNGSKWSIYGKVKQWDEKFYLRAYREHIQEPGLRKEEPLINHINELKGKLLVGEHYPKPSHGDILAELANAV